MNQTLTVSGLDLHDHLKRCFRRQGSLSSDTILFFWTSNLSLSLTKVNGRFNSQHIYNRVVDVDSGDCLEETWKRNKRRMLRLKESRYPTLEMCYARRRR